MNESQLILADFIPRKIQNPQTIGLQDIDIEKLFKLASTKGQPAVSYLYIATNIESVFKTIIQKVNIIKAAGGLVKMVKGIICLFIVLVNGTFQREKWKKVKKNARSSCARSRRRMWDHGQLPRSQNRNHIPHLYYAWQVYAQTNQLVRDGR